MVEFKKDNDVPVFVGTLMVPVLRFFMASVLRFAALCFDSALPLVFGVYMLRLDGNILCRLLQTNHKTR